MKKTGGIIAVLSGVIGLVVAGIALFYLFSEASDASESAFVFVLAIVATVFSLLIIILGILVLRGQSYIPGVLLMLLSILGMMMTSRLNPWFNPLTLFMFLPFIGGFLASLGTRQGNSPAA